MPYSTQFVVEKVTDGIYYTVMDQVREDRGSAGVFSWTRFWGALWELYVGQLLDEAIGDSNRVIKEERLKEVWSGKNCDRVVIYEDAVLLIEAEGRRMTIDTVALGGLEALEADLERAVLKKARQLAESVEQIAADPGSIGLPSAPRVYWPVVVLPGPLPLVPPVVARIRESVAADPRCRGLAAATARQVVVLDAEDYETLLGTAATASRRVVDLLGAWQESPLWDVAFRNWLKAAGPVEPDIPVWLSQGFHEWMDGRLGEIGLPT